MFFTLALVGWSIAMPRLRRMVLGPDQASTTSATRSPVRTSPVDGARDARAEPATVTQQRRGRQSTTTASSGRWPQEPRSTSPEGGRTTKPDPARRLDIGMEDHLLSHRATVCL
ncbi:hypothetical protein [Streptomyces canus]|uniref:hypothetical protein n=1 Tax=Streptomyces canus TaxID=58343 RepID=UPI002E264A7A